MRNTRVGQALSLVVCGGLLLSACGGGGTKSPTADGGTTSAATVVTRPLHVVSVEPATLTGTTPIVVTFRRPLEENSTLPTLSPAIPGQWSRSGSAATFTPARAYPPDTKVTVSLVHRPGAVSKEIATRASGNGSLKLAQQILARLHYLPLTTAAARPTDTAAEYAAIYNPPKGKFHWRYSNTPSTLKKDWVPGQPNTVLRGAVIAFQHAHGLTLDGAVGPATWKALIRADLNNALDPNKYSFVDADLYLPQRLSVWVDGSTVLTSPVNGGVAGAPTPLGTYPVYERFTSTTMQGTNPDGSHYKDPGVPWVNYFSGGSAVHGFPRASYGYPQSVGCLELPIPTAKVVYGMIGYGTLVNVHGPYVPATVATPQAPKTPKPKTSSSPKSSSSSAPTTTPATHKPKH